MPSAPQPNKPIWTHPIVLLAEEAQVEARFGLFGDSANRDARYVHGLHGRTICLEINLDALDRTRR